MSKNINTTGFFRVLLISALLLPAFSSAGKSAENEKTAYDWTTDHMQVGVRWQPFSGSPGRNAADAERPVIAEDSSYAQFWVSWGAAESSQSNTNYLNRMSRYLSTIETAVNECNRRGLKVEFVFWHCPAWASVSGNSGGWKAKPDHYSAFVTRIARHFKGRVHAYQLAHETNLKPYIEDGDVNYLLEEVFIKGARAIRSVYNEKPAEAVIISTSGCSPCEAGPVLEGLKGKGGAAVSDLYDRLIADSRVMEAVDALNMNVTDHFDGFGNMDGTYIPSTWGNYDLIRSKLDASPYSGKSILASESWIVWDGAAQAVDVNGDGEKNEQDAYIKAVTIIGKCMERGLNTINLPWSDNSSGWAMGLTKRRDFCGGIKRLKPKIVIKASDGGADIVTRKLAVMGDGDGIVIRDGSGAEFSEKDYINPSDPNHLHYYVWRWYAQIAGGSDEVIRHAMAGEYGNDIKALGPGFTGSERYRISSYNRTKKSFTVLLYASGANGDGWMTVSIPSTVQNGRYYNNDHSVKDFRGEGFSEGDKYRIIYETKDISMEDGSDVKKVEKKTWTSKVENGQLTARIPVVNKFTRIEFIK